MIGRVTWPMGLNKNYTAYQMRDNSAVIHLVGETIDARRAHHRAQVSELIQLVRGVYVEPGVDAEMAILGHAVRIAHYLYPRAYLSSASAVLLAPTPDGPSWPTEPSIAAG